MHATGRGKKSEHRQYKLKDAPTEGHKPKPPRQRGRTSYPWIKQLVKAQQPYKSNKSSKQKSVQKGALEEGQQRMSSGKTQPIVEESEEGTSNRPTMNVPVNEDHNSASSLKSNRAKRSSSNQVSQHSSSSLSPHTGQSSDFSNGTVETPETRTLSSTDQRGTTPTNSTMTSSNASTTPTSCTSTATNSQITTRSEKSETSTDDYASRKRSARNEMRKLNKRKPRKP
ncbi:hypothetical protein KIN20_010997 [Parelaphostrongylus tenuis]|uniref:Uncharacterized protein n=1 Tax=Parelaphostrongylus tenuis TaxID=148309 RepID=A0AAD5QM66_PARTN|nr:hypothetical protein KIN20_010997 [Parelaphostrongylus tenuis]